MVGDGGDGYNGKDGREHREQSTTSDKPNFTFFFPFNITSFKMFYYFKKNLAVCFAIFPLLLRCEVSFSLFQETDRCEKRREKGKCFSKWPLF